MFGSKHVPMLDKFDEQLETFCKENVLYTNNRILHEYMLDPASQKPDKVKTWIHNSTILKKVNMDVPILGYPLINSVIDWCYFTVKEQIETMQLLVTNSKAQYDELSALYLKQKELLITVIVDAENSAAAVKRVWEEIQAQHEQQKNCHFKESENLKNTQLKLNHYHTQQISQEQLFVVMDNY